MSETTALSLKKQGKLLKQYAIDQSELLILEKAEEEFRKSMIEFEFPSESLRRYATQHIENCSKIFKELFKDYPSSLNKAISRQERGNLKLTDTTFVYGEIHFKSFAIILERIKQIYGGLAEGSRGVFVDIGSGSGKASFAAALLHDFDSVVGIEILEGLHKISTEVQDKWEREKDLFYISEKTRCTSFEFIHGDALQIDWSNCTLGFANSTCFSDSFMQNLARKSHQMNTGAFFITFTRRLPSEQWKLLENERYFMSWGEVTVFIHQKVMEPIELVAVESIE